MQSVMHLLRCLSILLLATVADRGGVSTSKQP